MPIFKGIASSTSRNQPPPSNPSLNGEESVSSHSSSEAKVRGVISTPQQQPPTTEVDLVRSALASRREGSGSLDYDYSDLVETTSESNHTKESSPSISSSSNLPPNLPPRKNLLSDPSSSSRGFSSSIESPPPALPRRPNPNHQSSSSPENSISSHVETKAERKEREANEKLEIKNEKLRIKEEANVEKQRVKDEAVRVKEEAAAKKLKDQEDAKREKERLKWRKEKKKNEEVERSILEASVEELEIAQFLNSFGKVSRHS